MLTKLTNLPIQFQLLYRAQLFHPRPHEQGEYHLVKIRQTEPGGYEELKVIVSVIDENEFPMPNIPVAFSYSTAKQVLLSQDFTWTPPAFRADVFPTTGSGQIEHIQGSVIKEGEPGGITVFILDPRYSSAYVSGVGALANHAGVHLTFQLQRQGVIPINVRLDRIEDRLKALGGF